MTLSAQQSVYKLQTWFSPSYPIGAYTHSHGLENAFETGNVTNVVQAIDWIGEILSQGAGFSDAVFLSSSHSAAVERDMEALLDITQYAAAFCGTKELRLESFSQGQAFLQTAQQIEPSQVLAELSSKSSGPYPYCVVTGALAGEYGIDQKTMLTAYLHAFVSNLSSALVRIVPLGQTDGQRIIAALEFDIEATIDKALTSGIEELSTATLMVDITSMHHETQYTRLFRS